MAKIIGIDLGTTNSCVAIMEGSDPKVLVNEEGARTTPSVVAFAKDGDKLVGQIAKRQAVTNPENTIFSAKRFIGRRFDEISEELKLVPYNVVQKSANDCGFKIGSQVVSPEEIGAAVLAKLKKVAEDYVGSEITEAVITVPAYFNDAQRQATKDAGRIAGLEVKRIINEPTAAALAYGFDKSKDQKIAVYDLGGGTFDISILEVAENGGETIVEVKATNGDTHLGGDNFDTAILQWMVDEFKRDQGIDLTKDKMALQRLKEAAEKAKIELSQTQETEVNLPFVTADATGPKHMQMRLSRAKFEQMTEELVKRSLIPCQKCLEDSGFTLAEIDEVILVGGSTRIPSIQKAVRDFFGKEPNKSVNPDEVVAIGAAIQGGVLTGSVKQILLLDVTPLSLGIETLGGVMTKLIEKNTAIPTKRSQKFSTASDNQTSVDVHVCQGEREMAKDNKTLGRFELLGIRPAPRGGPQIEVTFDLDANGILNVSAKDLDTGKEQAIKITAKSGLTEEEINRMVKDAEEHAEEDRNRRERAQIANDLDTLIYNMEKVFRDQAADVDKSDKEKSEELMARGRTLLANLESTPTELREIFDKLQVLNSRISSALYDKKNAAGGSSSGAGAAAGGTASGGSSGAGDGASGDQKGDDVIDADYKDVR